MSFSDRVSDFQSIRLFPTVCSTSAEGIDAMTFSRAVNAVLSAMSLHLEPVSDSEMEELVMSALMPELHRRKKNPSYESIMDSLRRFSSSAEVHGTLAIMTDAEYDATEDDENGSECLDDAGNVSGGDSDDNESVPATSGGHILSSVGRLCTHPFGNDRRAVPFEEFTMFANTRLLRTNTHLGDTICTGTVCYAIASYIEALSPDSGQRASANTHSLPWGIHDYARELGREIATGECVDALSSSARALRWYCKYEELRKELRHQINDYVFFSDCGGDSVRSPSEIAGGLVKDVTRDERHDEEECRRAYEDVSRLSDIWATIAGRASHAKDGGTLQEVFARYGGPEMLQAARDGVPIEDVMA